MENDGKIIESKLTKIGKEATISLIKAWDEITGTARAIVGSLDQDLPRKDLNRLHKQMHQCAESKGGEVKARNNTIELGRIYLNLSETGKKKFLIMLLEKFDINHDKVIQLLEKFQKDSNYKNQKQLIKSMYPPRYKILKQFSALSNGLKFVVDMRSDILKFVKDLPELSKLEDEIREILSSWFDIGLLDMQPITWDSSASLLEKLIKYEAVHEISSWNDLRNRLDSDRCCFAFFHYKMPQEPLIFVEVALNNGIATNIQHLLDESAPIIDRKNINSAIFYSISNAQHGLSGISLGNFLIKEVVEKLSSEFSNIKNFATLSPIPLFMEWFRSNLDNIDINTQEKESILNSHCDQHLKQRLMQICAYYLIKVKKGTKAFDPVANFHFSNGASIKQINWKANTSKKGMDESSGMMVNYCYELNKIDSNHENYISNQVISCSRSIHSLAKSIKVKE